MKISKTTVLAAALAVAAIGSGYAPNAKAEPNQQTSSAIDQTATALPGTANGYHFAVLSRPVFTPVYGRRSETNPSHDDVSIGLVRDSDGQIVRGVTINKVDFDMSPDGMGDMTARTAFNGRFAGVFHLKLYPSMAGNWAIHLSAQVPHEANPVQGTVTVALVK